MKTYDHELTLIAEEFTQNDQREWVPTETSTVILCREQSVGRSEFYGAATAGHRADALLVVHRFEYGGQRLVEYEGLRYRVLRTYALNTDEIELTCEMVTADG